MIAEEILNWVLALGVSLVLFSFLVAHRSGLYPNFNLIELIVAKNGKPDRSAIMEIMVFALMCWAFVVFVNERKLPEWFVTIFVGAFVLRAAHSAYLRSKGDKEERTEARQERQSLPPVPRPQDRQ